MIRCRCRMLFEMQSLDFLPAGHDSGTALDPDVSPHAIQILMINSSNIFSRTGERDKVVAGCLLIMIRHSIRKAANNCFGDVYIVCVSFLCPDVGVTRTHTFVFRLSPSFIPSDKILVIHRSHRLKVHRTRDIQQYHRVICWHLRSIVGSERRWHNLSGVPFRGVLDMTSIKSVEVPAQLHRSQPMPERACANRLESKHTRAAAQPQSPFAPWPFLIRKSDPVSILSLFHPLDFPCD